MQIIKASYLSVELARKRVQKNINFFKKTLEIHTSRLGGFILTFASNAGESSRKDELKPLSS